MNYCIDIQNVTNEKLPLTDEEINHIASLALKNHTSKAELTIRIVPSADIQELNYSYRNKDQATNVLAFPSTIPEIVELEYPLLGDIIVCPEVLIRESVELHKDLKEHWSLILIHGVLHLLGYDHIEDDDAELMQAKEIQLLAELGFNNPYI